MEITESSKTHPQDQQDKPNIDTLKEQLQAALKRQTISLLALQKT